MNYLVDTYFDAYIAMVNVNLDEAFDLLRKKDWTPDSFRFYTAVSVISSSRIEGETLEIDSYLKHKIQAIEYLPNLTEKPNDLFEAYEFARDNQLTQNTFLEAHKIATKHLLVDTQRGKIRSGNMLILDQKTQRIKYEAPSGRIVQQEFDSFWKELDVLIRTNLSTEQVFYYASLIHLVFVKIHPFNDGNGRTARLLEKWFLATKLGEKAWYIGSEFYYYSNLQDYYNNLAAVGLFYDELDYKKSIPFLEMLAKSLQENLNNN